MVVTSHQRQKICYNCPSFTVQRRILIIFFYCHWYQCTLYIYVNDCPRIQPPPMPRPRSFSFFCPLFYFSLNFVCYHYYYCYFIVSFDFYFRFRFQFGWGWIFVFLLLCFACALKMCTFRWLLASIGAIYKTIALHNVTEKPF